MKFIERAKVYKEVKENWKQAIRISDLTEDEIEAEARLSFFCYSKSVASNEGDQDQAELYMSLINKIGNSEAYFSFQDKVLNYIKTHDVNGNLIEG